MSASQRKKGWNYEQASDVRLDMHTPSDVAREVRALRDQLAGTVEALNSIRPVIAYVQSHDLHPRALDAVLERIDLVLAALGQSSGEPSQKRMRSDLRVWGWPYDTLRASDDEVTEAWQQARKVRGQEPSQEGHDG